MEQKKPETIEEMTRRIREEEKSKLDADKPKDVTPTFDVSGNTRQKKSGGMMNQLGTFGLMAGIAIFVAFIVNAVVGVSASKFNSDISSLNNQISVLNSTLKTAQTSLSTSLSAVSGNQTNDESNLKTLTSKIDSISNQLNAIPNSYATTSQVNSLNSTMSALQNTVNQLQASLQNVPSSSQLTSLQNSLNSLQTQLNTDEATIKSQGVLIATLQNSTTTTTTTTTTNSPTNVTATVLGNVFSGSQLLPFSSGIPISGTATTSFQFTLANNTGATINNVQLAIGLETLNASSTSTITLPPDASLAITSSGSAVSWASQGYVQTGLWGFTNNAVSGIFGSIGAISQGTGTTTYTINITVTAGATNSISPFNIFPLVKVVSYQ